MQVFRKQNWYDFKSHRELIFISYPYYSIMFVDKLSKSGLLKVVYINPWEMNKILSGWMKAFTGGGKFFVCIHKSLYFNQKNPFMYIDHIRDLKEVFEVGFKHLLNMKISEWMISPFDFKVERANLVNSLKENLLKWLLAIGMFVTIFSEEMCSCVCVCVLFPR